MTAPWYRQKNITEIAASLRTALGFGTAADQDVEDFATPDDLSALETSVNAAIAALTLDVADAGNLSSGTVSDARLPARLGETPSDITDWNNISANGWYRANGAANAPMSGWLFGQVIRHNASFAEERLTALSQTEYGSRPTYLRHCYDGTWEPPKRIYQTAEEIKSIVTDSVKAWVRFYWNGTSVSILASKNVSSVVRNGVGDYTVNFASALADGNYAMSGSVSQRPDDINQVPVFHSDAGSGYRPGSFATASSCRVGFENRAGGYSDPNYEASLIFVR